MIRDESEKDGLAQLASTLRTLSTLAESGDASVVPEELMEGWRQVARLLSDLASKVNDLLAISREVQQEQVLHNTLQGWNRQLLALKPGSCALLPLTWTSGQQRHAVLALLRRSSGDTGTLVLLNLVGSGTEYHPQRLCSCATRPRREISPVTCSSIPWSRLSSTVFWLFMLRPLMTGMERTDSHPALLYEALLPFLTKEDRGRQLRRQKSSDGVRWCPVPRHDDTKIHVVFEALTLAMQSSHPPAVAEWLLLMLRFQSLKAAPDTLGCRLLARHAADLGEVCLPDPVPTWKPSKILEQIESWLTSKLEVKDEGRVWPSGVAGCLEPGSLNLSGFQRLVAPREEEVDEAERPPLVLPVPLVLVSRDTVQDYHGAAVSLRNCVRSCALLMNQRGLVSNADRHVVAMVQHLFYEVLPMPVPTSKGVTACFWRKMPMYYETQASLVRELWLVVQYFLASSLSLPLNTHHHSVRLLTLVSALCVLDAVVRRNPPHSQNDLSRVYSGALRPDARSGAFAVLSVQLAESTEELPLSDPHAQEIRSGLLDYFASAGETQSRKARRIFGFNDMRLSTGDKELLHRLALLRGCMSQSCLPETVRLGRYLTGEVSELLSAFPALAALRDVSFLVHLMCVKITSATLDIRRPDGTPWSASDLLLKWEYNTEENRLRVTGLGRSLVLGEAFQSERPVESATGRFPFLSRMGSAVTSLWSSQVQTPALLSAAGASHLAGQHIQNEDDVLQTPELPSFGHLSQAESEELLSFLTVPYLRVPLLLQFFNDRKRFTALNSPQLQAMLDAALFEPGPFQESKSSLQCPDTVYPGLRTSPQAAQLLTTPAGRLVHEMVHSPSTVLGELDGIFRLAMERDVPHYTSGSSAVLYAVRLWTRVTAYADLVARCASAADAAPRGFQACTGFCKILEERSSSWASRLFVEAVPMLERWCRRAMTAGEMQVSCMLWLHLALIQRWSGDELTPHGVSTLLCAELFLNANLDTSGMGTRSQAEQLGFLDTEIFELFHATRSRVYRWLRTKTSERDKVFEHVVSTVASSPSGHEPRSSAVRRWVELEDTWDGSGRFAAAGAAATASGGASPSADEDFSRWLSASVDSAPVEVNVNLGQLQFRQHNVTAVPREVMELPEFQEVFPDVEVHSCLLWALVEKAQQRERYRFAGLRYEFHLWKLEETLPEIPYSRRFPQHATMAEEWITSALSTLPEMQTLWTRGSWYAPKESQGESFALLYVSYGESLRSDNFYYEDAYSRPSHQEVGDYKIFEVEIFRHGTAPAVVHVYHVCRVGPRFGRSQVLSSSSGWSHAICQEDLLPRLLNSKGMRSAMSLEIVHEELSGESKLLPRFVLKGALPDALLELYDFWRGGGRLVGKLRSRTGEASSLYATCLVVHLSERHGTRVQRLTLDPTRKDEEKQLDELMFARSSNVVKGDMLVDLLRADPKSNTYQVAQWLLQLEDLSHVLAWSGTAQVLNGELMDADKEAPLTLVELPRLGLSFSDQQGLRCDQHGGLKVVCHRNFHNQKSLERLLKPFPRFVLLEDDFGDLFLLSSLAERPKFSATEGLQWHRGDASWLSKLRLEQRHQLYRIFTEFLIAPSLLSELHLMLLRVAQGMFSDACSGVMACISSGLPQQAEESLLWDEILSLLRGDDRLGAVVLRLKLVLQLHRQGQGIPENWNPEADFLEWANHGWEAPEGQLLTLEEEAALLDLLGASSDETNWELRARSAVQRQLLHISAAGGHVTKGEVDGGPSTLQLQRSKELGTPGPLDRGRVTLDAVPLDPLHLLLDSPSDTMEAPALFVEQDEPGDVKRGVMAVSFLLRCLPLRLSHDFLLLYELLNGSRTVWLLPSDDPTLTAELLARLVPSEELFQRPVLAALLRIMESQPSLAQRLPRFGTGGGLDSWIPTLLHGLKGLRQELRLAASPQGPVGPLPSALWTFERSGDTWRLADTEDTVAEVPSPKEQDLAGNGKSLSNGRLLEVVRAMGAFGDRRLVSETWDFDCRRRSLRAEKAATGKEAMWQGCIKELHERWPSLAFPQLPALASKPFMALGLSSTGALGSSDVVVEKDVAALKFLADNAAAPQSGNASGRALLRRLKADFQSYGELRQLTFRNITSSNASQVLQERHQLEALQSETESLIEALKSMLQEDTKAMYAAIEAVKTMANTFATGSAGALRRLSGELRELSFQDILHMLLVEGGIEDLLPHLRPSMEAMARRDIAAMALLAMRFSARVLLCRQSVASLQKLKGVADRQLRLVDSSPVAPSGGRARGSWWSRLSGRFTRDDTEDPLAPELAEAAAAAAATLGAEAHSMDDNLCYDPRLVVFEFISQLVLRKKQVTLVRAMQKAVEEGEPLVHQMLMGEGKTTVVTPLVILLHGSATRACVVCVPQALTEFTCRALRERLCATLARPVLEFTFNRATPVSDDHFFKLLHAQDARAVMVSGPTALKSLMLRFVLTLHACDVARSQEKERLEVDRSSTFLSPNSWTSLLGWPSWSNRGGVTSQLEAYGFEARALAWALDVFQGAVLILDDIDLLMHPLRSELHWPLGTQHLLDFTASGSTSTLTLREDDQNEAAISFVAGSPVGARWQLAFHLLDGFFSSGQGTLVPGPAYTTAQQGDPAALAVLERLRATVQKGLQQKQLQQAPHLVLLSLDFYHKELRPILADWALVWLKSDAQKAAKLKSYWCGDSSSVEGLAKDLGDAQLKAVNLIRSWLSTLFPHLASRIHRVHYGLLDEGSCGWPSEAPARRQLAVPFVGKDAPSESSQFSHPDVLIGLTWLAYRFGGLRQGDFRRAVKSLAKQGRAEEGESHQQRSARRSWAQWVRLSGAHLRGADGRGAKAVVTHNAKTLVLSEQGGGTEAQLVPPLEWMDSGDATQLALVFSVMKYSPFLMEYYLHALVLPSMLRHADAKLSANGQDLGGEVLCSSRLGFSGTPNDLLPRSLGQCRYAQGDDAKMLTTLSDPQVVSVSSVEDGWNAHKLLQMVAKQNPPLNALIDVGALITGLSNEQVARTLLDYGLPFEAVVFCDSGGGQQLLRRGAAASVKMSNCTLPLDRRFVFYDQVHTTGIDIRHPPHACAALTLGKDSTFRDFAQGAYRLRGIKKGQRLQVLLTPEVAARIEEEVSTVPGGDADVQSMSPTSQVAVLDKVCAWLLVRQASAEQTQRRLLSRQAVQYQGRRFAYETLVKKIRMGEGMEAGGLLDLFRERVDYTVEASLAPGSPMGRSLRQLAESVSSYLDVPGKQAVNVIVSGTNEDAWAQRGEEEQSLFAEMEQEHEQELFAEQEEEKEQEQEEEEEEETGDKESPSASSFQRLPRCEAQSAWPVELLRKAPHLGDVGGLGRHFRPAKAMAIGSSRGIETANFPQELWASQNFHRGEHVQRLRPVVALLEWTPQELGPDIEGSSPMSPQKRGDSSPSAAKRTRLHTALELHGLVGKASISAKEVKALLASLGVTASPSEVDLVLHSIVEQAADDACQFDVDDLGENSLDHPSTSSVCMLRKALSARTVASALRRCHAVEAEPQRFYALLSLGEAEGLRALMHRRDLPCRSAALKLLRRESLQGLMVLDTTKDWKASPLHWHETRLAQSLAFLAAQTHFSQHVLDSLWQQFRTRSPALILEALPTQAGSGDALRDFFVASMTCRRCFVQDGAWREAPVAQLFASSGAWQKERRERTLSKAHRLLTHAGVSPEAAFAKLDSDQDGEVTAGDFAQADALGLELPKERLRLFETLDTAKRGSISTEEWMVAFEITRPPASVAQHSGEPLPPPEGLPLDVLRRMVIEVVHHTSYTQLWTSKGMLCQKHMSIWAPEQLVSSFFRVTALKVSVGHYANRGFTDARGGDTMGVGKRFILQVRDRQTFGRSSDEYLQAVADHYCPCPIRWRQVWSQSRGTPLYLWRPVPPSDGFVALGMVATTSPEPPPLTAARCVCKSFCRPSAEAPLQLWDDSGSGGKPASVWLVNSAQVLWASVGHNVPHETFWELAGESITFDYVGRPSLHVVHEVSSPQIARDSSAAEVVEQSTWSLTTLFSSSTRTRRSV